MSEHNKHSHKTSIIIHLIYHICYHIVSSFCKYCMFKLTAFVLWFYTCLRGNVGKSSPESKPVAPPCPPICKDSKRPFSESVSLGPVWKGSVRTPTVAVRAPKWVCVDASLHDYKTLSEDKQYEITRWQFKTEKKCQFADIVSRVNNIPPSHSTCLSSSCTETLANKCVLHPNKSPKKQNQGFEFRSRTWFIPCGSRDLFRTPASLSKATKKSLYSFCLLCRHPRLTYTIKCALI